MRKLLLKTMLLLCALIVGSGTAWADTSTLTFTSACGGNGTSNDGLTWNISSDAAESSFDSTSGIHYGTSKAAVSYLQLATTNLYSKLGGKRITNITINARDKNGASISVTVGSTSYTADSNNPTMENTSHDFSFGGDAIVASGDELTIRMSRSSAKQAMYVKSVVITYTDASSPSAAATTTTINSSGITNTDVYVNTAAGSLSATVTPAGSSALSNPAITWSSSNEGVATIASDGTVTLVAAGTTTITASYAGVANEYQASSDTYELTVTSSAPYVQPTEFNIAFNNTAFGCNTGANAVEQSFTTNKTEVVAGCASNASSKTYYDTGHVRFYQGSYLILTAPTGYNITGVVFTAGGTWNGSITPDGGLYNNTNKTWTGNVSSLRFDFEAQNRIASAAITLSSASAVATTTTISDAGITNTDVYAGTAAGSLSATVTSGGNAVAGATVAWSGNNDAVATIDASTGAVTLVGAGSVTFTASYAGVSGEYQPSSDTYEMTVTSSAPYVQPTEIEITPNYEFWGQAAQFSGSDNDNLSGSKDNVELEWERGTGYTYASTTAMRFYKDNTLTFTAPTGYEIKSIALTMSTVQEDLAFAPSGYDTETKTWTGSADVVTMSRPSNATSYAQITKITITIGSPSSVGTPTFTVASDTYTETQNVKVSNYDDNYMYFYTTDGTDPDCDANLDPTGTSVVYNHTTGINISATTTLKMIAADIEGNKSAVATATYTFPTIYTTIESFMAANTTGYLNLTGAQVVYIDGDKKNIYVRDASGAIDLYNSRGFSTSLTTGDVLSGTIYGKYSPYKNLPEITNIADISVLTATSNSAVVPKVIAGTTEAIAENLCDLVKIENTVISESNNKHYVGDNSDIQLYDNFGVGYTVTTGEPVDVSGIATVYNTTYEIFPRVEEDIVYLNTSVEVSIPSATGFATFCSTEDLDFTAVDAIHAYIATVSGDAITFTRKMKIPANTGVLLWSSAGGAVAATNVPVLSGEADVVTGNLFVAATTQIDNLASSDENSNNYILNVVNNVVGFYRAAGNKVGAGKAYLAVPKTLPVRSFVALPGGINTGIQTSDNLTIGQSDNCYDLQGRRISTPKKGLYIVNGKKVLLH